MFRFFSFFCRRENGTPVVGLPLLTEIDTPVSFAANASLRDARGTPDWKSTLLTLPPSQNHSHKVINYTQLFFFYFYFITSYCIPLLQR